MTYQALGEAVSANVPPTISAAGVFQNTIQQALTSGSYGNRHTQAVKQPLGIRGQVPDVL
jgi:hypothetical protein